MIEYVFSDGDQKRIGEAERALREYEAHLLARLQKQYSLYLEVECNFLSDPVRAQLLEAVVRVRSSCVPVGMNVKH